MNKMCILCDKPLKTLRKITWQKEVCGNPKCEYYNVANTEGINMIPEDRMFIF